MLTNNNRGPMLTFAYEISAMTLNNDNLSRDNMYTFKCSHSLYLVKFKRDTTMRPCACSSRVCQSAKVRDKAQSAPILLHKMSDGRALFIRKAIHWR